MAINWCMLVEPWFNWYVRGILELAWFGMLEPCA